MMIGIIGGSGLSNLGDIQCEWVTVDTPFGRPSDQVMLGELEGTRFAFLPRHGRGHVIPPSEINYQANIYALKKVGVTDIVSMSAVGSLQAHLKPGMFVVVDQFIDRTFARKRSFFETGCVAHVSVADPVCHRLGKHITQVASNLPIEMQSGGTYLVIEGPQFSTKAESKLYREWGCDVIGMTNMPEARLAREAEICYASVAMVTDFDCWHPDHDSVTVSQIIKTAQENAKKAAQLIQAILSKPSEGEAAATCACKSALRFAIMTQDSHRQVEVDQKLALLLNREKSEEAVCS
ncbi:S-methyl-5'-thioadenosine phosphorylase [Legionella sp.]|uniref:S-methyl-5'-thioadenosine phosphorylase n=1 Tax=Legionella sp. TaxID=459 RepID=UPI003220989A